MIKALIATLMALIGYTVTAQGFQGQATYESKTTVDMDGWGGKDMTPDMKAMIKKRMKSMLEKTYILDFTQSTSMYKEDVQLAAGGGGGFSFSMNGNSKMYKDVRSGNYVDQREMFGKTFKIEDDLPALDWKLTQESRKIGNYTAYKATAMKPVAKTDWMNARRKRRADRKKEEEGEVAEAETQDKENEEEESDNPMDNFEIPEEIEVVAWYTPEIPVNQGPAEYWGLPGLILEVSAGRTTLLCSKIVMNPEERAPIEAPRKGEKVTQEEYDEKIQKMMTEMQERGGWGGGRRGRGGRRG